MEFDLCLSELVVGFHILGEKADSSGTIGYYESAILGGRGRREF